MFEAQFPEQVAEGHLEGDAHPCVVVWSKPPDANGDRRVLLAPISHSLPNDGDPAVPLSRAVATRIGLDDRQMWIRPDKLTSLTWPDHQLAPGLCEISRGSGQYAFPGKMPGGLLQATQENVSDLLSKGKARVLETEKLLARYERQIERRSQEREQDQGQELD